MSQPATTPPELPTRPPRSEDAAVLETVSGRTPRSRVMKNIVTAQNRERIKLLQELSHIRGFLPLLMKRRNGQAWSPDERTALLLQFRSVAHVSPYLVVLLLPGSFVIVPILAWWLDRRRQERDKGRIE